MIFHCLVFLSSRETPKREIFLSSRGTPVLFLAATKPRKVLFLSSGDKLTTKKASKATKQPDINQKSSPNQRKIIPKSIKNESKMEPKSSRIGPKSLKIGPHHL